MAQSESNWLVTWLGEPLKEIILQNDVSNGICVNFYSRTTLRETFMSKNIGFPSYQNRQFTFPSETTSISVILIWESHPTSLQANSPKHGSFEIALSAITDTRLVIFVSILFKRQNLRHIVFTIYSRISKQFLKFKWISSRLGLMCHSSFTHACNILLVLS